jgi:hypothetical protein
MASALSSAVSPAVAGQTRFTRRSAAGRSRTKAAVRNNTNAAADVETYDTVVIGAGVSGLTTAFTLGRSSPGVKLLVTEARDYVGGNINSKSTQGADADGKKGYTWVRGWHLSPRYTVRTPSDDSHSPCNQIPCNQSDNREARVGTFH